jgi:hypothetical protein
MSIKINLAFPENRNPGRPSRSLDTTRNLLLFYYLFMSKLAMVVKIQNMSGSNLGRKTGYPQVNVVFSD